MIDKSSRHSKITGDFGEYLLLYLLSKHGFEVFHVDHTGIDLVAYNKASKNRYGISVKSRSKRGKADDGLLVPGEDYDKIILASQALAAEPHICFIVDKLINDEGQGHIHVFLMSLDTLDEFYGNFKAGKGFSFATSPKKMEEYKDRKGIFYKEFRYDKGSWIG